MPQLTFARSNGIEIFRGNPKDEVPGVNLIIPQDPSKIIIKEYSLDKLRESYLRNVFNNTGKKVFMQEEIEFLAEETKWTVERVRRYLFENNL